MKYKINGFAMLSIAAILFSCNGEKKSENAESQTNAADVEKSTDEIITSSATDKDGKKLEMVFNNTKGLATVTLNDEKITLTQQKSGSGIWYKNDHYELSGKGNDVKLTKDGKTIFEYADEIVESSLKNKAGQTLRMIFNNSTNEAKVYLDNDPQIDLIGQKAASGIWYKNDHYELSGKGDDLKLTKDGKIVFKQ